MTEETAEHSPSDPDELLRQVAEAEREAGEVEESKRLDFAVWRQTMDRSRIAMVIVWSFVLFVGLLIVYLFVGAIAFDAWGENQTIKPQWVEGAKEISRLLQSVMMPIVTLVLGFYFGTSSRK